MSALTEALEYVGGFSRTTKMPGYSYSIPAVDCIVGSRLRLVPGSVCSECYACKGNYTRFPAVARAMERRLASLERPHWVPNMVTAMRKIAHFRWHDSGDLQSGRHLARIVEVCRLTSGTRHWLPTRERAFVSEWLAANVDGFPGNLVVRVSANMIDARAGRGFPNTSTVHFKSEPVGHTCPASSQSGRCGECRACWDRSVPNVSYPKH